MEAEAEQIESYVIARSKARVAALSNRAARLREYALDTMRACSVGTSKDAVGQPDLKFRVRANPPAVVIDDEASIPAEFLYTPDPPPMPLPRPDKKAIGAALKAGQEVAGARQSIGYRLEIL